MRKELKQLALDNKFLIARVEQQRQELIELSSLTVSATDLHLVCLYGSISKMHTIAYNYPHHAECMIGS